MKKIIELKNTYDLKMTKQQMHYDVRLQEEILRSELQKFRTSISDSVKTTARKYAQKITTFILIALLRGKSKARTEDQSK